LVDWDCRSLKPRRRIGIQQRIGRCAFPEKVMAQSS
jgi:hypothetical protein